ncbi:Adaptive-response sensory-kinase SasA [bioreactor metagenome]|uniref:histidine kinase n=1 Tax=bioreactor metagenome TaxID=1076179 RepID=A0A645HHE5_9ZZZZ
MVAKSLTESVFDYAKKSDIKLTFTSNVRTLFMLIDKDKTERILLNLLSNAIKNTLPGGNVELRIRYENNIVTFLVIDDGVGISLENQEIIFDRFRQANSTLSRSSEGCGIGLSLTKGLVELLGGQINVQSKVGKGSTFSFTLPVIKLKHNKKSKVSEGLSLKKKIEIELSDLNIY